VAKTSRRFENHEGTSNKFWEIRPAKGGFNAFWGAIGKTEQGPKFYDATEVEKVIASKLKKGYEEV
jgi:predicted DNA-binding WGR domain protein